MSTMIPYLPATAMIAKPDDLIPYLKDGAELCRPFLELSALILYSLQTSDEQRTDTAQLVNGEGFSQQTAKYGGFYARWIAAKLQDGSKFGHCVNHNLLIKKGQFRGKTWGYGLSLAVLRHRGQVFNFLKTCYDEAEASHVSMIQTIMGKFNRQQLVEWARESRRENAKYISRK